MLSEGENGQEEEEEESGLTPSKAGKEVLLWWRSVVKVQEKYKDLLGTGPKIRRVHWEVVP